VCQGQEVFNSTLALLRPNLEAKHIQFNIHITALPYTYLYLDVGRIEQLIMNIVGNAIKFTPEYGTIDFYMDNVSSDADTLWDKIVVRDSGIGISKEFLPYLFQPFRQECSKTTSKYQGTGLGMTIAKQIVELMGGSIDVKSELGVGTEFTLLLPLRKATPAQMEAHRMLGEPKRQGVSLQGKRVLLCEDHPLNAQIARRLLEKQGVEVTHAENGKQGVALFEASYPGYYDAILMDIRMPVMDGLEASRIIRALPRPDATQIPILAMSANAFDEDVRRSQEAGINLHLSKPVDAQRLYNALAEWITR
ncbi:MAG: ATP-binding protein, partial [Gemmiger sp.]|nr:ATP-binding protein [Gemmiger sp.]